MVLYKACKCDSSIAVGACGVAISQEVVTLARMRELWINIEYGTGARSDMEDFRFRSTEQPSYIYIYNMSLHIEYGGFNRTAS